jgi:hypothetical protein
MQTLKNFTAHSHHIGSIVLAILILAPRLHADGNPPDRMTYQGFLSDASGVPLGNLAPKNYDVIFRIYNHQSDTASASKMWAEQQTVTLDKGYFSVLLGEGSPVSGDAHDPLFSIFTNSTASDRFVEVTVKGIGAGSPPSDVTILPRLRLLTSPYAFLARNAVNAASLVNNANGQIVSISGNNVGVNTLNPTTALEVNGTVTATAFSGNGANLQNLNAANITSGTLDTNRVPSLDASKIAFGTLNTNRVPILDAGKIGSGTLDVNRVPNLDGSKIASGTLADARLSGNVALRAGGNFFTGHQTVTSGYIGIGGSPSFPLHVRAYQNASFNYQVGDLRNYSGGIFQHNTDANTPYSIVADQFVLATAFQATSDRRIKENIVPSDTAKDLATVQKLAVAEYHFVDRPTKGGRLQKGFIAQDIQSVIPEAVSSSANFIPDIFSQASQTRYDRNLKQLAVSLPKPHQLKVGDRVRLVAASGELDLTVESLPSDREFVVGKCETEPGQVFVYGKYVTDLLSVNYDRIFTTGIGAIQELARRVEKLQANESRLAELEQKAVHVENLEREIAGLKKLVTQLAQTQNSQKAAAALESQVSGATFPATANR